MEIPGAQGHVVVPDGTRIAGPCANRVPSGGQLTQRRLRRALRSVLETARKRTQGFALFTLVAGVVAQVSIAALVAADPGVVGFVYAPEVRVLALAGAGISVAVFLVPSRTALWAFFAVRALVLGGLFGALHSADALLVLMAAIPPLIESATYERFRVAAVTNLVIMGGLAAAVLLPARADAVTSIGTLLGATFVATLYLLAQYYREALVARSRRITNLEQAFQQLTDSNLGLQLYASNAETESAGRERTRITRELHDSVGYALTNIGMMMKAARVLMDRDRAKLAEMIDEAQTTANDALREARTILYRLRSVDDETYQGMWAISRLVKAYRLATDVDVEVHYGNLEWSLGRQIDRAFYRLVQEALTNAYRHGGATQVRITMWMGNQEVVLQIWDNGRGAQVINEGIGLAGMRERMEEIGGTITADNTPDGFEVTARIPWRTGEPS